MKWRTTAIYLLVLLIIGGVYIYIDAQKKESARKEKESRRVFVFDAGAVKEIEIKSGDSDAIRLEKADDKWRISQPIASDVDKAAFAGFFSALQDIEQERNIGKSSDNLANFGLDKPSLVIRLLAGSDWLELRMGGKNPAETSRYANAGEGGDVFMITSATDAALNKGLKDLRSKELFSWQPDQVSGVDVKWSSGESFTLERQGDKKQWKSANQPGLEIKAAKVQNLIEDLHWLRAVDFVGKDAMPASALVEIKLQLNDGKTSELRVADSIGTKKQAVAACSEIQDPVLVASNFLSSIPRSVVSLVDRSLISLTASDIRSITWKTETGTGNLVWMDENNWGTKDGEAPPKAVENAGLVRGLLAFVENAEYSEAVEPGATPPEATPNRLQLADVLGKKSSLTWDKLPVQTADPVTVWIERDGAAREVKVKSETVKRLNESLAKLNTK